MAKNLNSVGFTVLLLVLLMASTEILKTDAACWKFLGECGPVPYTGSNADCTSCCEDKFGAMNPPVEVCAGRVEPEGQVDHCHCYGRS